MFDKLIDILTVIWRRLLPFVVIDEFEAGVVLRLGRFHRELEPGFHWLIPFAEETLQVNTVPVLHDLPAQSIGGRVFRGVVTWRVRDPKKFLLGVEDGKSAVEDAALGALARNVCPEPAKHARRALLDMRRRVAHWGIVVERLAFADHVQARTFRVIGGVGGIVT
jgi:regulator of protease activity HflC (stomatin/prohibitin superfamily)